MRMMATGTPRKLLISLLTATVLLATSSSALAQDKYVSNRRWIYGLIAGVVVGGAVAAVSKSSEQNSGCSASACAAVIAGLMAGGVGFLIGRDVDKKNARRYAAGPSLKYDYKNFPLGMVPDRMTSFPGGAAVIGLGGAKIVMKDGTIASRAVGVRGIEDVALLPSSDLLVLSTASSLIAYPAGDVSAQGQVIDDRGGGSMVALRNQLAVAGRDSLRVLDVKTDGEDVSTETVASEETFEFIVDMTYDPFHRITWVLSEDVLSGYTSDLRKVAEVTLPAPGRTVRARGSQLVVAAGASGVYVLDTANPSTPRVVKHFTGVRFAYAADLDGSFLYVAAGNEGVPLVDITGSEPSVVGVARQVSFASDVVVAGESEVWILDRERRQIQIAEFEIENASSGDASDDRD